MENARTWIVLFAISTFIKTINTPIPAERKEKMNTIVVLQESIDKDLLRLCSVD